ncbi:hypothetical protein AMECASPLE_014190 [Ameca splendens]|uniref:Uncharacterized protein n=1 Tax=Ameca splendens TaxID=208324 RepID=A0ABV1A7V7_9TELE
MCSYQTGTRTRAKQLLQEEPNLLHYKTHSKPHPPDCDLIPAPGRGPALEREASEAGHHSTPKTGNWMYCEESSQANGGGQKL